MQEAVKFWDGIAEKYAQSPVRDINAYEHTLERTRAYLTPNDAVLELGAGTGSTALKLAPYVKQIFSTDLSSNMMAIANRKLEHAGQHNVTFQTVDVFEDMEDEPQYDVVLAFNLIHLLKDTHAALEKMNRLVKPGGYLISKTVCNSDEGMPIKLAVMKMLIPVMQWLGKAPFVKFMEIPELERAVETAGFRIVETGNYPKAPPNRFIVAQKI